MAEALLDEDQAKLLDLVDSLGCLGIHQAQIPLPQLVVCGEQSAGKSSLLEAISDIKFPVNTGQCTRFPTQVILRRSPTQSFNISIQPGPQASEPTREKFKSFTPSITSVEQMTEIISEATKVMQLNKDEDLIDNVLKIEVSGPNQPHLTLVDLPGLIQSTDDSVSNIQIVKIKNVVRKYMENERSIILAVLSAANDFANQGVRNMIREIKNASLRTLGVITKPDRSEDENDMELAMSYARNQKFSFGHGWHVVKNANSEERKDEHWDRTNAEAMFLSTRPWNSLPKSQLGVPALKHRLSNCLSLHISESIPQLIEDIELKRAECSKRLKSLGEPRKSPLEQRLYVSRIADEFHTRIKDGILSQYNDDFFKLGENRLRASIHAIQTDFADQVHFYGRTYNLRCTHSPLDPIDIFPRSTAGDMESTALEPWSICAAPEVISCDDYAKLVENSILKLSRGLGLPTMEDPSSIGHIFQNLSTPWRRIADVYARRVFEEVRSFVEKIVEHSADEHSCLLLLEHIIHPRLEALRIKLTSKISEVFAPYTKQHAMSFHPALIHYMVRLQEAAAPVRGQSEGAKSPDLSARRDAADYESSVILVHKAAAYYEIMQYNMIDNVNSLAIESCLLEEVKNIFTTTQVIKMEDEEIAAVGAEAEDITEQRKVDEDLYKMLTDALEKCRLQESVLRKKSPRKLQQKVGPATTLGQTDTSTKPLEKPAKKDSTEKYKPEPHLQPPPIIEPTGAPINNNTSPRTSDQGLESTPSLSPSRSHSRSRSRATTPTSEPSPTPKSRIFKSYPRRIVPIESELEN